jgi:hypothetical protein
LEEAIGELRQLSAPSVDRAALERLLGVSPRQALRILHTLSPHQVGKNLAIERTNLIERLETLLGGDSVQSERRRAGRVSAELDRLRRHRRAEGLEVPETAAAVAGTTGWASLPDGIRLAPGRLEITFASGGELLAKLFSLAQAVAADPEHFRVAAGDGPER